MSRDTSTYVDQKKCAKPIDIANWREHLLNKQSGGESEKGRISESNRTRIWVLSLDGVGWSELNLKLNRVASVPASAA